MMLKQTFNNWIRKQRVIRELRSQLVESIGMNWWKRARNTCNRLDRVRSL